MNLKVKLKSYDNSWYNPGAGILKRVLWYFTNEIILKNTLNPFSNSRIFVLKIFGAKIGKGVVIKPGVNIKFPWKLKVGDYCWIGENTWIDNLDLVILESNVCLSQNALLLCGNHDYKKQSFDLVTGPIIIKEGSWVGAKSVVCKGVTIHSQAVLTVNSVASKDLDTGGIYRGNPAVKIRERNITL